uniref:ethanolamine-phosphate cytidylyltransferase n=1 Tax=Polytomella parva TaxID=51329 RepID=A0A7S0V5E8_9CHLO|mmetsp:Transcript_30251/g.55257  ORF Transcript_30251/g.55257 Transcript_30251/m.55257 type:complete len:522 (+) Transcript_30251:94-1659(+)|eukprot:CAMPEP_0175077084 /NCGR_PEP_ID=MMETSP0052_2-20121109/23158_1 /TAXON_ID=51329 ORGANISM="Polytomella parva, Strain SAG 63-3" /NCGR_SAMPLE_ID=MMETSP0052_2 /ASSEMBLY_ACC=CAM_ASM_000194 /LENGTH=521 /DNA_ID=CAMNT_0016346439 /DNA_START=21 /DNA_END=1586 /DNA_ORIENTATION=+
MSVDSGNSGPQTYKILFWSLAAATSLTAASAVVRASKKTYETYVPLKYQYRPGTISGWLAKMLAKYSDKRRKRRPVRVYLDGCFDMMHYGHANALRQARAVGDQLVVGLIPDSEIVRCKGPPVMDEEERFVLVDSVKWVDEIITGVPYDLSPEFISELFTKHRIDYIIHGDDPCLLPDGSDAYAHAKKLGRFKMVKRTEGVSTTDIVGRMLMCSRVNTLITPNPDEPHPLAKSFSMCHEEDDESEDVSEETDDDDSTSDATTTGSSHVNATTVTTVDPPTRTTLSKFLPTSRRLVQFSNGKVAPEGARIVYVDGAFDCFHPGHVKMLKAARTHGDFLLVGLHTDADVMARRGPHLPIMNLHERSLAVLACRFVDEVIIGSPCEITEDLIRTFNIGLVARGTVSETRHALGKENAMNAGKPLPSVAEEKEKETEEGEEPNTVAEVVISNGGCAVSDEEEEKRYGVAKAMGIYKEIPSPCNLSARNIIYRIVDNRAAFEQRNAKKVKGEEKYYTESKVFVQEL